MKTLPGALTAINAMRGVEFHWQDQKRGTRLERGFVAQELQRVLPEAVVQDGDHLGVTPLDVIPVLVEAIKELSTQVNALQQAA